jgi:hypothetical protein
MYRPRTSCVPNSRQMPRRLNAICFSSASHSLYRRRMPVRWGQKLAMLRDPTMPHVRFCAGYPVMGIPTAIPRRPGEIQTEVWAVEKNGIVGETWYYLSAAGSNQLWAVDNG